MAAERITAGRRLYAIEFRKGAVIDSQVNVGAPDVAHVSAGKEQRWHPATDHGDVVPVTAQQAYQLNED